MNGRSSTEILNLDFASIKRQLSEDAKDRAGNLRLRYANILYPTHHRIVNQWYADLCKQSDAMMGTETGS